jgi:hypothetical protein
VRTVLDYVSPRAFALWIAAHVVVALSIVMGKGLFNSWLVAACGCSTALLMAWPMYRTTIPVGYSGAVRGVWPRRG